MRIFKRLTPLRTSTQNLAILKEVKYVGIRTGFGCEVWVSREDRIARLKPRYDLRRYSPAGFDWAFDGPGSSQLALALLANWSCDDRFALRNYAEFKLRLITSLPYHCWDLNFEQIKEALELVHHGS